MSIEQLAPDAFDPRTECRARQKTPGQTHTHVCRKAAGHDADNRATNQHPHQCTCGHTW